MLTLKCKICRKTFNDFNDLITHLKIFHNVPNHLIHKYIRILEDDKSNSISYDLYHLIRLRVKDVKLSNHISLDTKVNIDNSELEITVEIIVSIYNNVSITEFEAMHNLVISAMVSYGINPDNIRIKIVPHSNTYATLNYYITTTKLTIPAEP